MPKPHRKTRTVYYIEALGLSWNAKTKKWEEGNLEGISENGVIRPLDGRTSQAGSSAWNKVRCFNTKRKAMKTLRGLGQRGIIAELDIWKKGNLVACLGSLPEKNPLEEAQHNINILRNE